MNLIYELGSDVLYNFKLSGDFLTDDEKKIFKEYLEYRHLDETIWGIYECLFKSATEGTIPLALRVYKDSELCGLAIIIRYRRYGRALFNNKRIAKAINKIGIPCYLWMRFNDGMDSISNTGFVVLPEEAEEIYSGILNFLHKKFFLTFIYDYTENQKLYPRVTRLPSMPHGLVDCTEMKSLEDYLQLHKNIKRKIKGFTKNGGTFEIIRKIIPEKELAQLKKCFITTSEKSMTYTPYQDLYLSSVMTMCKTPLENIYYFIVKLDGEFIGYQAAIKSGMNLITLHGAFDRERKTTFHAYDILFTKMVEFAIENNLKTVDFGPINNVTKERMVNQAIDMSYFIYGKFFFSNFIFEKFFRRTNIQSDDQLKFHSHLDA